MMLYASGLRHASFATALTASRAPRAPARLRRPGSRPSGRSRSWAGRAGSRCPRRCRTARGWGRRACAGSAGCRRRARRAGGRPGRARPGPRERGSGPARAVRRPARDGTRRRPPAASRTGRRCERRRRGPGGHSELGVGVLQVRVDGRRRDHQLGGDLLGRVPAGHQPQHLDLSGRQPGDPPIRPSLASLRNMVAAAPASVSAPSWAHRDGLTWPRLDPERSCHPGAEQR